MDFPIYHLDFLNNRFLIAIVAILHVVINHGMAVGGIPLVAYLERRAIRTGDQSWDLLAYRIMFFFFIVTTTLGAMSGVGIWLSVSLVNPTSLASLLRVFFWAWAIEWVVFITEVLLILWYFLSWKPIGHPKKIQHLKLGYVLSGASWITMAIIVSILGFMMDTGAWNGDGSIFSALFNPVYLPQLMFRTPLALVSAGTMALALYGVFRVLPVKNRLPDPRVVLPLLGGWTLFWTIPLAVGAIWYRSAIPKYSVGNLQVAVGTQAFADWYNLLLVFISVICGFVVIVSTLCILVPKRIPMLSLVVPAISVVALLGLFERVREFIRKPYAIQGYLYSNGYRVQDYALLQRDGILKHATFSPISTVTPSNKLDAGEQVFLLACSRCHTVTGVNSIRDNVGRMYGYTQPWDAKNLSQYIGAMHNGRSFMPPFPGNLEERDAVAEYIVSLQFSPRPLVGVQASGIKKK
jgi:mono/diheme cytochrome c family protein